MKKRKKPRSDNCHAVIIALGSNQGDSLTFLKSAHELLCQSFRLIAQSRVYTSQAVDYKNQPDFFNQVSQFETQKSDAHEVFSTLLAIEKKLGRIRDIPKGPRCIDLDLLFFGEKKIHTTDLTLPHPRWHERSFVVLPLQELPFFKSLSQPQRHAKDFEIPAYPLS